MALYYPPPPPDPARTKVPNRETNIPDMPKRDWRNDIIDSKPIYILALAIAFLIAYIKR
jgi:hypothetical protein